MAVHQNTLIRKLDKVFSEYIRLRDSDSNGICRCITCGRIRDWKYLDCGHYIKRQYKAVRFNEINCNAQCKPCNGFDQGSDTKYRAALVKMYGEERVLLIESGKRQVKKWAAFELEYMIKKYTEMVHKLKAEKGL